MKHKAKKSFGQHFLKSADIISAIVKAAEIKKGETVLEIGPGTGALTSALLDAGARVIAVEADRDLIQPLKDKFGDRLDLICGDALRFNPSDYLLSAFGGQATSYKLIANLPYNVASEILEKFFKEQSSPSRMVVMVQKEVGERILAKPGDMSVLSVAAQIYNDARRIVEVPPSAFNPRPKVDSLVVRLDRNLKCDEPEKVIALAKAGFSSRRKQLHKNFNDKGILPSQAVKKWLAGRGLSETARAQELSVDDWIAFYLFF